MSKLDSMQRYAERLVAKADVDISVKVRWSGGECKLSRRYHLAHAHTRGEKRGTICVRRGLDDWRDTIRHEVAHFLPSGDAHGRKHQRNMARLGDPHAKAAQRRWDISVNGARHRHDWRRGSTLSHRVTRHGFEIVYEAQCALCGKRVPA